MTVDVAAWGRIPEELRNLRRWCIAAPDKSPLYLVNDKLYRANVVKPETWMPFEQAAQKAWQLGYDIGFVLAKGDGYSCIDLDVKDAENMPDHPHKWTPKEVYDGYLNAIKGFNSYTERSRSGKGFHIWVRGEIGPGARKEGVELYSQERFIICTGKVVNDVPIQPDHNGFLQQMIADFRQNGVTKEELEEIPPEVDDWYIALLALNASNGEKFCKLWSGDWHKDYPSQSEADLALMSMFTFYTKSNSQCKRLFRASALGKREKAVKNDKYLNNTLITIRSREKKQQEADITQLIIAAENKLRRQQEQQILGQQNKIAPALSVTGRGDPVQAPTPPEVLQATASPISEDQLKIGSEGIPWPPGFMGALARQIYPMAAYPVKEVAITAALGLMAGICGRAWQFAGSGLNLYITLVALSGVGKELLHTGTSTILAACRQYHQNIDDFVMSDDVASGQALIKACAVRPSFVGMYQEWGQLLSDIAQNTHSNLRSLKRELLSLYSKSSSNSRVGGIAYSNQENNIESMGAIAYSMVGESTPQKFYESLTEDMMSDGFLSRFLIIEYKGDRPERNEHLTMVPDEAVIRHICGIAQMAKTSQAQNAFIFIERTEQASLAIKAYEKKCDNKIIGNKNEAWRQLWSRAALKMQRIASLLAVCDNPTTPVVTIEQVEWAMQVVQRNIELLLTRIQEGDVGQGDNSRTLKMITILKEYQVKEPSQGYRIPKQMWENGIVPRSYLQNRVKRVASFVNHKVGSNAAFKQVLDSLIENGVLLEIAPDKILESYSVTGKHYRIMNTDLMSDDER